MTRLALGCLFLPLWFACSGAAQAFSSAPRRAWIPAEAAVEHAPARGVHVLRPPLGGRVRILGGSLLGEGRGSFIMGSSDIDIVRAVVMCRHELLRNRCDDIAAQFRSEGKAHEVTVFTFEIDRTEVTVADYGRCVAAGACAPPAFVAGDARFDRPRLPVTHVRWEDAAAYCSWAGGRLPTEAEWELAARGPSSREFPWGNLYNPRLCNHGSFAHDETDATDGFAGLAPVGSFPDGATPLGLLDMAGNAAEWVQDLYDVDENGFGYAPTPQVSPKGPPTGAFHVVRGGAYTDGAAWVRAASRGMISLQRSASVGFRCAADVK